MLEIHQESPEPSVLLSKQLYADTARAATWLVVAGAGLRQPGSDRQGAQGKYCSDRSLIGSVVCCVPQPCPYGN